MILVRDTNQIVGDDPVWEDRWARFSQGLLHVGVSAGKHDFSRSWVRRFFGFLKPRRYDQAQREDVEIYLADLVQHGKAGWQVDQANRALELFYRDIVPLNWAQENWPETPAAGEVWSQRPADVERPPPLTLMLAQYNTTSSQKMEAVPPSKRTGQFKANVVA